MYMLTWRLQVWKTIHVNFLGPLKTVIIFLLSPNEAQKLRLEITLYHYCKIIIIILSALTVLIIYSEFRLLMCFCVFVFSLLNRILLSKAK